MEIFLLQFCFFVIYSFIGWVCETVFCSIAQHRFVNRGFLSGPFCPIYGFGALLVLNLFSRYEDGLLALFLLSVVVTSVVEYLTSFLLEKLFHLTLWDYSNHRWNLNGRVCLRNSLLFGVMSVAMVKVVHPLVVRIFEKIPQSAALIFLAVLSVYFLADVVLSVIAVVAFTRRAGKRQLELDDLAGLRKQYQEEIQQKTKERWRPLYNRLVKAFPNMKSTRFPDALREAQEKLKKHRKK